MPRAALVFLAGSRSGAARLAALLTAALLMFAAACSGDDGSTSSPSPEASTPVATATASVTATSSATPVPPGRPVPPSGPVAGREYGVIKVHRNDPDGGLIIRTGAGLIGTGVVGVIPFNATAVISTGQTSEIDGASWFEVTYESTTGWVNGTFLSPIPSFDEVRCGDPGADYSFSPGAVPSAPAPADPEADHVLAMHQYAGPDCERTVVTFGRDFNLDADAALLLEPAAGVPAGIQLGMELATVRVALPETVLGAASTATESYRRDNGFADLFFIRPSGSARFGVIALWDRNRAVRYFYLENPGRLVIDTIDAPTGSGLTLGPVTAADLSELTVLAHPINVDVYGPAPAPPIVVTGFGRPFEATTVIRLRTGPVDAAPGSGRLVNADWSGSSFAEPCGSQYAVMTSDWLEAWGEFSFTIEALAPGSYELFVGEDSARDGSEVGVYHGFVVGGSTQASC